MTVTAAAGPVKARLSNLCKTYGALRVVDNVSLDIFEGEFLTLLGPSGSGKTTLLQMLAGLTMPSSGRIEIDGRDVTTVPPYRRDIGVVFQSYALFPHLSVRANIEFPLAMRRMPRRERRERAAEALDLVQLGHVAERLPRALSGGQQQRVALARALVFQPSILLMDEPLGALDRSLRQQMQIEIMRIHRALGVTTLYVTHDQEEALSMSDRIGVVKDGVIAQIGPVNELYEKPASSFIASFVGSSNVIRGRIVKNERGDAIAVRLGEHEQLIPIDSSPLLAGSPAQLCVRPERLRILSADETVPAETPAIRGVVEVSTFLGSNTHYHVRVADDFTLEVVVPNVRHADCLGHGTELLVTWSRDSAVTLPAGSTS